MISAKTWVTRVCGVGGGAQKVCGARAPEEKGRGRRCAARLLIYASGACPRTEATISLLIPARVRERETATALVRVDVYKRA